MRRVLSRDPISSILLVLHGNWADLFAKRVARKLNVSLEPARNHVADDGDRWREVFDRSTRIEDAVFAGARPWAVFVRRLKQRR